ncbi:MAG: DUF2934 domain-containing protein [Alphaproteobacteria bacterium]|nr:DUF2934 domain-containing protein [Alphaproteobacteria bacterium]
MEDKIRELAYQIWEEEGCPHGREIEHWNMAQQRLLEAESKTVKAKKAPAKKKVAPKKVSIKKKVAPKKKAAIKKK